MSENNESFRDSISTVDESGKRVWVYPKKPSGRHWNYRQWFSYTLLLVLFVMPLIHIDGDPLFLFNFVDRRFIVFGQTFFPQDFHLFALFMITGVLFITLFTLAFGRLFCGWACPQTLFMEMVFRRVEYWIEGDFTRQKKLDKQPWDREKILKRLAKHSIFFGMSVGIANCFLAWVIGTKELVAIVTDNPMDHIGGLSSLLVFSALFYGVFAFMREQVCTVICPYGRLQGVLLDRQSIVIAYDHIRGEGRAKFRKNEDRPAANKGDCIDCNQCVNVCPTGIDIRNGTQLECVNCTACIDACDHMMEGVGLEKGLIRYASADSIEKKRGISWNAKRWAYTGVLVLLMIINTAAMMNRAGVEVTILRSPGMLYEEVEPGRYANVYKAMLINKTDKAMPITVRCENPAGELRWAGEAMVVDAGEEIEGTFLLVLDQAHLTGLKTAVELSVYSGDEELEVIETTFIGPGL